MKRRSLLVTAILTLALAAPAGADPVTVMRFRDSPASSVALAGDRVLALSYFDFPATRGEGAKVLSGAPGIRPSTLAVQADHRLIAQLRIAGSATQALITRVEEPTRVLVGTPSGPVRTVDSCPYYYRSDPAADGDLAAWPCGSNRVTILKGGDLTRIEIDRSTSLAAVAVGGRFVAWVAERIPDLMAPTYQLTVFDTTSGEAAYVVDDVPFTGGELQVQDDGTSAVITNTSARAGGCPLDDGVGEIRYYTALEPRAHVVPLKPCTYGIRLAKGRIAFMDRAKPSGVLSIARLDGTVTERVARANPVESEGLPFDFDGAQIAWGRSRCSDAVVQRRAVGDGSPTEPGVTCPVRVGRPRVGTDFRVPIACPRGCRALAGEGMSIEAPFWLKSRHPQLTLFRARPGGKTTAVFSLSKRQRTLLRKHPRARVRFFLAGENFVRRNVVRTLGPGT